MAGKEGIDTRLERSIINYRPNIEYTLPRIVAGEYERATENNIRPGILTRPVLADTWNRVSQISEALDQLEEALSEKLKNDRVPIDSSKADQIIEAGKRWGYELEKELPFSLYKAALNSPDSIEKTLILDCYEDYHADVNGEINAELYTDVVEMKQDWEETSKFVLKGLFGQVIPPQDLPSQIKKGDPIIERMAEVEVKMIEDFVNQKLDHEDSLMALKNTYLRSPDSESFFNNQKETLEKSKSLKTAERAAYGKIEVYELVNSKILSYGTLTSFIENAIDFKPYVENLHDILQGLLRQYSSRQSIEKGLRRVQALIKLSIDGKIEKVNNTKQDLRGMVGIQNKKRMNSALINGIHLKKDVLGDVRDVMDYFDAAPENQAFDVFANHIVDSIVYADTLYEDQLLDFHKIHALDGDLRGGRLKDLIDKDSAREIYKLIDKVIHYAKSKNSWPSEVNLSEWLTQFLKSENIS